MNPHMPMTHNEDNIPVLLVATQAPLDVLHRSAASRFLAVTQMMESLASLDITGGQRHRCAATGPCGGDVAARWL
ncbi:hypothetical protein ACFS4T_15675 [Pseudomonas lini]